MRKGIINEKIATHSDEWYAYRLKYINSTDVGGIMGLSPYTVGARIFNEKIGRIQPWTEGNKHTFLGLYLEEMISTIWKYYDPTGPEDNYVQNHKEGKIIRNCKRANGYFRNEKYPWLSTSLDYLINKGQTTAMGEVLKTEVPLETKSIDAFLLQKWESIPTYYLAQVHVEMLVLGVEYSEVVLFDSRKNLHIYPVEYSKEFGEQIIDITHDFSQKVDKAKELMNSLQKEQNEQKVADIQYAIDKLEPTAGMETPAYEDFLKDKYKDGYVKKEKEGTMDDWENVVDYNKHDVVMKGIKEKQQLCKNKLLASMGSNEYLSFGEDGHVSYIANKNGVRSFRIKLNN